MTFANKLELLTRGYLVAEKHCKHDASIFYLIVNRHIGDSVKVFNKLKAIKQYYGVNADKFHTIGESQKRLIFEKKKKISKLLVVTTKALSGVAQLYSKYLDGIIVLAKEDLDALEVYATSGCTLCNNIVADGNADRNVFSHWKTAEGSWTRWEMYHITDLMWNMVLPTDIFKQAVDMEIDDKTDCETDNFLREHNIDLQNSVIIVPKAQSSSMLSDTVWEKYAELVKNKGLKVYTNVANQETPIRGTIPLEMRINVLICLAHRGCRIIGVQCGLLDAIVMIYPKHMQVISIINSDRDKQYANNMGAKGKISKVRDVTYFKIEQETPEEVVKLLIDNFDR